MGHLFKPGSTSGIGVSHSLSTRVITGVLDIDAKAIAWSPTLGLFATVGSNFFAVNPVITSPDGIIWTQRVAPAGTWRDIIWSPDLGLFCAVGAGVVMTSPNGINWTAQVPASADDYQSVTWASGIGLLVAVSNTGGANSAMTSPNGIAWTLQATPFTGLQTWAGVEYSPQMGTLCAVSPNGAVTIPGFEGRAMTSVNGVNWILRDVPIASGGGGAGPLGIAWSPKLGIFAAVESKAGLIYDCIVTSPDGISWTRQTMPITGDQSTLRRIVWSPDQEMFAAVSVGASLAKRLLTSLDGITWFLNVSNVNTVTDNAWADLAWSPALNLFAIPAASGGSTNFAAIATAP